MENKELLMTDKFWSAVKRKQMQEVLSIVFEMIDENEASEIAATTTRLTDQAVTRMRNALGEATTEEVVEETVEPEEGEEPTECQDGYDPIRKAIAKGKGKKALKHKIQYLKDISKEIFFFLSLFQLG